MSAPDPSLIHILSSCLSHDSSTRVPAEKMLQETLAQAHGCIVLLLDVVLAADAPQPVRALAATCAKNCVNKRWKRVQNHPISPDEKTLVRARLLSSLLLGDPPLFRVVAAAAAKILRFDWAGDEFPQLFPAVFSLATSGDPAAARRGMQALHALVKELSSVSLHSEKAKFVAICPQIAAVVAPAWMQLLPIVSSNADAAAAARVVAKIYKHSLMRCASLAVPGGAVFSFLESCCQISSFTSDLCCGRSQISHHEQIISLTRTLFACMRSFIKTLPVQCTPILPNLSSSCIQLLVAAAQAQSVNEGVASLTCRVMSVLEAIFYENLFKPGASTRVSGDPAAKQLAEASFGSFFTESTVSQLVKLLASSYCSLSSSQLARWDETPEAFANEFEAQSDLVPSARAIRLVIQLAHRMPSAVGSSMNELVKSAEALIAKIYDGSCDVSTLLLCDAILGCVQETCHDIKNHVALSQIASSLVIPCMSKPNCHRIIIRRGCLFLGETSTLLDGVDRNSLFHALAHALNQADAAVALAACSSMCQCMDGLDLSTGQGDLSAFLAILPGVIQRLMQLLEVLEEEDSKSKVLHAICLCISHAGPSAAQLASSLIAVFPHIWEVTRNSPTTQPKCLMLVTSLINCAREVVSQHIPSLCSIIAFTVNASDPTALTTREYALDAWLAVIRNISSYTEELHKLFEHLVPLLNEDHCENIKVVTRIVDGYSLLGGSTFAVVYSAAVLQGFMRILPNLKEEARVLVSQSVHVMFVAVPGVVGTDASGAICAAIANLATSPATSSQTLVAASYFGVLARYCFVNSQQFIALCRHLGENALDIIMESMFQSMDQAPPRIACLMLSASLQTLVVLATSGVPPSRVHALAHGAFNAGVNACSIFASSRPTTNHLYSMEETLLKQTGMFVIKMGSCNLYVSDHELEPDVYILPERIRKQALATSDPISAMTPKAVLSQAIQSLRTGLSQENLQVNDQHKHSNTYNFRNHPWHLPEYHWMSIFMHHQALFAGVDPDIVKQVMSITQQP